ncbi:MAG: hypothetical protein Q7T20_11365 [Saprospiraceae bacterium]|nr:hypothetical protein [Saprospiraceae bacterium]
MATIRFWLRAFLPFCFLVNAAAQAPVMTTISSRWQDSFVEWEIFSMVKQPDLEEGEAPDEEYYGELKLRWLNVREDWSEWDFDLGGQRGTIRQKWKDDPQQWELRTYSGAIITMRTSWNGDFKVWRVSDNTITLNIRSKWTTQLDEWQVQDDTYGNFYLYTLRTRDPRDWAIEDNLDPAISEEMKLAMIFLVIFNSSPKI